MFSVSCRLLSLRGLAWANSRTCPRTHRSPLVQISTREQAYSHSLGNNIIAHPVVYHDDFTINPIPDGHRFPMPKDALLFRKLQELGLAQRVFTPVVPDLDTLCLVHDEKYVRDFIDGSISKDSMRRIGLPWSKELVQRTLIGVGSAILAGRLATSYGIAVMCNGGTHHAHRSHGSGWCIFNDQAVAARSLQRDTNIRKVMFIDLDVHMGDGTASIFAGDASVFTLSVHCEAQSFPIIEQKSDLDISLPAKCTDEIYLEALRQVIPRTLMEFQPDIVMYNAGVDVHEDDQLGKMSLTLEGIYKRDYYVFQCCLDFGVPVSCAIGGGYSGIRYDQIVDRHIMLHRAASEFASSMLRVGSIEKNIKRGL